MNKHQVKGRAKAVAGKVKEKVGSATGNDRMSIKGTLEKHAGKAEAAYGDIKHEAKKDYRVERRMEQRKHMPNDLE